MSCLSDISDSSDIGEISEAEGDGTKEALGGNAALEDTTADNKAISEEAVMGYLKRRPMTTGPA